MSIDTATLLLVNVLLSATMALCLGLVAKRAQRDGLFLWAVALAVHSVAYVLLGLRGHVSGLISVVLANTLLSCTMAFFLEGLHQFQRTVPRRWLIWSPVAATLLLFPLVMNDFHARVALIALILCLQLFLFIRQLGARWRETPGKGKVFVLTGFALFALVLLVRAVAARMGKLESASIAGDSPIQALTFLSAAISTTLAGFGLVLMSKERADELNLTLAMQDELTGLNNRRQILQALAQHVALAGRNHQPLAVLILDIDFFKRVNDTHGHLSGDRVLRDLATCLRSRLRSQDIAGRWGGEEFIVVLPNTDGPGAQLLAEQLRLSVERTRFTSLDDTPLPLTVSIGLHVMPAGQDEDCDQIIATTDRALYQAKQSGRNRVATL